MSELTRELSTLFPQFYVVENYFPLTNTVTQLTQSNPLRWGLLFGSKVNDTVYAVTTNPNLATSVGADTAVGLPVNVGSPIMLSYRDWGALVQQAWYATGVYTNVAAWVIEVLLQQ